MQTHKLSISVPTELVTFVEEYKSQHHIISRSEVIATSLKLLQQQELKFEYKEAYADLDEFDRDLEILAGEGLEDETW